MRFQTPLVIAMVGLMTAPAVLATHNSVGFQTNIVNPNEIGNDGLLQKDVANDLLPQYHTNLAVPRTAPPDQSGLFYGNNNPSCTPNAPATNPCYIGYLDHQWEYVWFADGLITIFPFDVFYPVSPEPGDADCPTGTAQQRIETAQKTECDGGTLEGPPHNFMQIGSQLVDLNLLSAPFEGAAAASGNDVMSGSDTSLLLISAYVYAFGMHSATNTNPSSLRAGAAPFAEVPASACVGRTSDGPDAGIAPDCYLLENEDFTDPARDTRAPAAAAGDPRARICYYTPDFVLISPPDARAGSLCGTVGLGDPFDTPLPEAAGGFNQPGLSTWINTKPGWYLGGLYIRAGGALAAGNTRNAGFETYVAINPEVPEADDPLWCVTPNIYTNGDKVHGTYQADAIDTDRYGNPFADQRQLTLDLQTQVINAVNNGLGALDPIVELALQTVEDNTPTLPPEVQGVLDAATALADEAADRADYIEGGFAEPGAGDSFGTHTFGVPQPATGFACNNAAQVIESTAGTIPGILRFNSVIVRTQQSSASSNGVTVSTARNLKDPTLLDSGLPARESETDPGIWQADEFQFGGVIHAVIDSSGGDGNPGTTADDDGIVWDGCVTAAGPNPALDLCPWLALWDAYNPAAFDQIGNPLGPKIDGRGYDLATGVGMYFVLKVTGPVTLRNTVTTDDSDGAVTMGTRTQVLGAGNPTGQNCIVGTSIGFADKLKAIKGSGPNDADLVNFLCGAVSGEKGLLVRDAFADAGETGSSGAFGSAVAFAKTVPTPVGVGLGAGDKLCVNAIFSVKAGLPTVYSTDTADNVKLGPGVNEFKDCDSFTPTVLP